MAKKFDEYSEEERKEIGRRGGIASGESRNNKSDIRKLFKCILEMPIDKGKVFDVEDVKSFANLNGKNINVLTAIVMKQILAALSGDLEVGKYIIDLLHSSQQQTSDNEIKIKIDWNRDNES